MDPQMTKNDDNRVKSEIRRLYRENEPAKTFFDRAADRKNDATETSVQRIAQIIGIDRYEALQLARSLHEAGCGRLIVGRKGQKTRFEWAYSLPALGKVARNESGAVLREVETDVWDDQQERGTGRDGSSARADVIIDQAKRLLADKLGISVEKIEILIRA
jgi:hypothetical protein